MFRWFNLNRILLSGALMMALQLGASVWADVTVTPEELAAKVTQYVQETTPLDDADTSLQVEIVRLPSVPVVLKGENLSLSMEDHRPTPLMFQTMIQVTLSTSDETRQLGVPVRLYVEKPVWVARHLIRAKAVVSPKDVMVQRKRMAYEALYSLGASENVTAFTARTNITPGTILDVRKLNPVPAVYRNDDVHMVLILASGVNITVVGKALEDGSVGQRIRVRQRLANNKARVYTGEVTARNTVVVRI